MNLQDFDFTLQHSFPGSRGLLFQKGDPLTHELEIHWGQHSPFSHFPSLTLRADSKEKMAKLLVSAAEACRTALKKGRVPQVFWG